ncbi:MAG: nicotinate (nicotinamide) nucleotide adenylyltransferase [Leptospirillum sp.]
MSILPEVAIYGGAFNPIHEGHLSLAREIQNRFRISRILFVPAGRPPHKFLAGDPGPDHRFEMLKEAIAGHQGWEAIPIEIEKSGVSYTVDTLQEIHLPERPWLLLGTDAFEGFLSWKDPATIMARADLLVASRPGTSFLEIVPVVSALFSLLGKNGSALTPEDACLLDSGEMSLWMRTFHECSFRLALVRADTPDISSTMVRGVLSGVKDPSLEKKKILPASVKSYIVEKELFVKDDLSKEAMPGKSSRTVSSGEKSGHDPMVNMIDLPEDVPASMARFLLDRKVGNIWVMSPGAECSYADHLIIGEVENERHRDAVMDAFDQRFTKRGEPFLSEKGPIWSLMDFGDVVIHLFLSAGRRLYRLEDLFPTVPLWVLSHDGHFEVRKPEDRHAPNDGGTYLSIPEPNRL